MAAVREADPALGRALVRARPRALAFGGRRRRRDATAAYLFLAPGMLLFTAVILLPIVRAFQISLYRWSIVPGAVSEFVGLDNYRHALHDPIFWRGLANTGFYMAVTVPTQIVLGLAVAVLLDGKLPARPVFRTLFYLPVITSWVVVSLLFRYLFLTDGGLVNGVFGTHVAWLGGRWTGMTAIAILGVWKGVGWSMVIFLAALQGVPRELYEAAAVDGAGPFRRFRSIALPTLRPVVTFVTVMLVIGGFNVFISVLLITNGGPVDSTQVLLTYMYRQAFTFLDFGYGSAIAFTLTLIVLVLSAVQLRILRPRTAAA